ncbi:hypothetical protein FYJ78_05560 [Selenomonas sp. WCA-380-WT-3B 3/]|uniref:Uncharacterized protein n=1 Tax=Selenomonas montiformis TaxID=2652285 RepID=A0A6I2UTW6_9FIRM|nr:hypothetical protein [Selenomonas montiformis]MSV24657.1 hypothetical protein [Selenomonas montiformis]
MKKYDKEDWVLRLCVAGLVVVFGGLAAGWLFLWQIAVQEDISREEYVRLSQEIVEQSRTQPACMAPDEP